MVQYITIAADHLDGGLRAALWQSAHTLVDTTRHPHPTYKCVKACDVRDVFGVLLVATSLLVPPSSFVRRCYSDSVVELVLRGN